MSIGCWGHVSESSGKKKSVPTWLHVPEMYEGSWHAKVSSAAEMSKESNGGEAIIQCHPQQSASLSPHAHQILKFKKKLKIRGKIILKKN